MSRPVILALTVLVTGLLILLAMPGQDRDAINADARSSAGPTRLGTKSERAEAGANARENIFQHLLALREGQSTATTTFEAIDSLAKRLTSAELLLLAEIDWSPFDPDSSSFGSGLERWVRSAAFAELGRRDGEGMVARLMADFQSAPEEFSGPTLFSVFRGWAEVDARAAADRLLATGGTYRAPDGSEYWQWEEWRAEAFVEVFKEWARLDPNEARLAVPPPGSQPHYFPKGWEGIFLGMQDPAQIRGALADWRSEPAERDRTYDHEYSDWEDGDRFIREELAESEVIALCHLADFGLPEMVAWLHRESQDPFSGRMKLLECLDQVLELYGCHHPDEALALIRKGELDPVMLGGGVAWSHPERTNEVLASLTDRFQIIDVLEMAIEQDREGSIRPLGLGRVGNDGSSYPAPGRLNLRSDTQDRYDTLMTAIENSPLEQWDRFNLLDRLHVEFSKILPAARAALGISGSGRID